MTLGKFILLAFAGLASLLTGCSSITYEMAPPSQGVAETLEGSSCAPIIFGLGFGTLRVSEAMATAHRRTVDGENAPTAGTLSVRPITRVKVVEMQENMFLVFGSKCLTVRGDDSEATPTTSAPEPKPRGGSDTDTGYDYRHRR